ncbi:hypothetical protein JHK87_028291 [Glycine soja]|nr:hypothetical protein JHK87_028291 [Glycine soja]
MLRWATIATRLPGRTDNEIKNFWHTHLKKRLERSKVINTYSNPLQEAQTASSARTLISVPRVAVEASGASSSRNPPIVGLGFYGVASSDILGQIIGNSSHSRQIDKELEFWYNVYMNSHHKGMKIDLFFLDSIEEKIVWFEQWMLKLHRGYNFQQWFNLKGLGEDHPTDVVWVCLGNRRAIGFLFRQR